MGVDQEYPGLWNESPECSTKRNRQVVVSTQRMKKSGKWNRLARRAAKGNRQQSVGRPLTTHFRWASLSRANGLPHPDELFEKGWVIVARHPRWHDSFLMRK